MTAVSLYGWSELKTMTRYIEWKQPNVFIMLNHACLCSRTRSSATDGRFLKSIIISYSAVKVYFWNGNFGQVHTDSKSTVNWYHLGHWGRMWISCPNKHQLKTTKLSPVWNLFIKMLVDRYRLDLFGYIVDLRTELGWTGLRNTRVDLKFQVSVSLLTFLFIHSIKLTRCPRRWSFKIFIYRSLTLRVIVYWSWISFAVRVSRLGHSLRKLFDQ